MRDGIEIFEKGSEERKSLELMASILTFLSPGRRQYYVGETYFDYGQDWKWTTILAEHRTSFSDSYQALYPRLQREILAAETVDEMLELAWKYFDNKHCSDKGRLHAHDGSAFRDTGFPVSQEEMNRIFFGGEK